MVGQTPPADKARTWVSDGNSAWTVTVRMLLEVSVTRYQSRSREMLATGAVGVVRDANGRASSTIFPKTVVGLVEISWNALRVPSQPLSLVEPQVSSSG